MTGMIRDSDSSRRSFIQRVSAASAASIIPSPAWSGSKPGFRIAPFRFPVTPPVGHPLCGGWIAPVAAIEDDLEAVGFVLLGASDPIVVCAVDWTGLLNDAYQVWRSALAEAAGTTPDRVAVQCVHQHDAPFVCLAGQRLLDEARSGLSVVALDFFHRCLSAGRAAVREALPKARPVTHVGFGSAVVDRIASNRRVDQGPDGKVRKMRGSSCRDADLIAMPEGLIDPLLRTVAFFEEDRKIAACHYYATHPMSHYGQGRVSSDFAGLARKRLQAEEPDCHHIYFTGCAGNLAAGKYNDGSPAARIQLTQRLFEALKSSQSAMPRSPLDRVRWRTHRFRPEAPPQPAMDELRAIVRKTDASRVDRIRSAMRLAYTERLRNHAPILLTALELNEGSILHLPSECFVEYQLRAQSMRRGQFVASAAYGDGGPWYIPTRDEYPRGGYEVSMAFSADSIDALLTAGIKDLLST